MGHTSRIGKPYFEKCDRFERLSCGFDFRA
jgi:hypothetical protein